MYKRLYETRFAAYLRNTWKQKLYAVGMIGLSALAAMLDEGDATMLVIVSCIAIPMFFSKRGDWLA